MGPLCWVWLLLSWRYPYASICLIGIMCKRVSTKYELLCEIFQGNMWIKQPHEANNHLINNSTGGEVDIVSFHARVVMVMVVVDTGHWTCYRLNINR